MTMNTSWGYKRNDQNWKSSETLIRMLVDIASKGGNLLLNVGPTAEGLIPEPSVERLQAIGRWMDINGESIYGTSASPFFKLTWGRCTQRTVEEGTTLYLHVFQWPEDRLLRVPAVRTTVEDLYLLSDPEQKLASRFEEGDLLISLPGTMPDPVNTVVVVKTSGTLEVESNMPSLQEGRIELPADFADIHNPGYGTHAILAGSGETARITNWVDPGVRVEWMFQSDEPGTYAVKALLKSEGSGTLIVQKGDQETEFHLNPTGETLAETDLGTIEITQTGHQLLQLKPLSEGWSPIELGSLVLVKE